MLASAAAYAITVTGLSSSTSPITVKTLLSILTSVGSDIIKL